MDQHTVGKWLTNICHTPFPNNVNICLYEFMANGSKGFDGSLRFARDLSPCLQFSNVIAKRVLNYMVMICRVSNQEPLCKHLLTNTALRFGIGLVITSTKKYVIELFVRNCIPMKSVDIITHVPDHHRCSSNQVFFGDSVCDSCLS